MTDHRFDLDPVALACHIDEMWWAELDQLHPQIIASMNVTAEAAGAPVGGRVSSGKPESRPPFGEPSLADRHIARIQHAIDEDLADHDHDQEPRRFRTALLRAAVELASVRRGSTRLIGTSNGEAMDLEREERIVSDWEGMSPDVVAVLETARGGWIRAAAVRSCRKRNDRHPETGELRPVRGELVELAYKLRYEPKKDGGTRSYAEIGGELGVAASTVMRWLSSNTEAVAA